MAEKIVESWNSRQLKTILKISQQFEPNAIHLFKVRFRPFCAIIWEREEKRGLEWEEKEMEKDVQQRPPAGVKLETFG